MSILEPPRTQDWREISSWYAEVSRKLNVLFPPSSLPAYANNAAAIAGGLSAGDFYRTGGDPDTVCVVH